MTTVNEQFSFERDNHGFRVTEFKKGKSKKTGEEVVTDKDTFHPKLESCLKYILDRSVSNRENIAQVHGAIIQAKCEIMQALANAGYIEKAK